MVFFLWFILYRVSDTSQPARNLLVEESRRREREVAKAIAEHDAALITKLQSEFESLQYHHECDLRLVDDLTARVAVLMEGLGGKDGEIAEKGARVVELERTVTKLGDTSRRQEVHYSGLKDGKEREISHLREENQSLQVQLKIQSANVLSQVNITL
jgi:hypothetical protein